MNQDQFSRTFILGDPNPNYIPPPLSWLDEIYEKVNGNNINNRYDRAVDIIMRNVYDMIANGAFTHLNSIFEIVDVEKLNSTLIVSFLCTTFRHKNNLPARVNFVNKAKVFLKDHKDIKSLFRNID